MQNEQQYLATLPFDLYDLILFQRVADQGSFTRAAHSIGLTQSAVTRRIAAMENKLGLKLLERTTRAVKLTSAGADLKERITSLIRQTAEVAQEFSQAQGLCRPRLRVGIANSVGLAYLPGFFHAFQRQHADVASTVSQGSSASIISELREGNLDIGIVHPGRSCPRELEIARRFQVISP